MKTISVYMAHSHEVYLYGLQQGLSELDCTAIETHTTGTKALHYILQFEPSIALIEADLPLLSAFDIMKTVAEKGLKTKFIVIFPAIQQEHVIIAKALQLSGTIYTGDSFQSILECIKQVQKGKFCFSQSYKRDSATFKDQTLSNINLLSNTELNILSLIAPYKTSAAIAKVLNLSERTIEKHRSNIISKLKLDRKTNSLTKWAMKNHELIQKVALRSTT